jgi:hypothetical protein
LCFNDIVKVLVVHITPTSNLCGLFGCKKSEHQVKYLKIFFLLSCNIFFFLQELIRLYGTDPDFSNECLKLYALCYLPGAEITYYFDEIEQFLPEQLTPVTAWLKTYYLKGTNEDNPMFSPDFWSVNFQLNENLITSDARYH